jgi:signal peptidase II
LTTSRAARFALVVAALSTIGCDQVTKRVASATLSGAAVHSYFGDTVRIEYAENTGGFLSMGEHLPSTARRIVFIGGAAMALVWMLVILRRQAKRGVTTAGATLFAAGAVSNGIDRVFAGRVIDFLNVGIGGVRTGVFNVADMAIMAGAALFLWEAFRDGR